MESFHHMFEDFILLCIMDYTIVQRFSYLLMISMELVDQGSTRHPIQMDFQINFNWVVHRLKFSMRTISTTY
jgi:hypothetical protein